MVKPEERDLFRHIKREWIQEIDGKLKDIESDLGELGEIDLAIQIDGVRHELYLRLLMKEVANGKEETVD